MRTLVAAVTAGIVMFAVGYLWASRTGQPPPAGASTAVAAESTATEWTCSMHPQIRQPKPGLCPLCNMDLIPVIEEEGGAEGPRAIQFSETARTLAELQVSAVERRYATAEIRMVGKVAYDETRLKYITARVAGRLDRLYVDYTGVPVQKGDHLISLYSPDLVTTQEALLEALRRQRQFAQSEVATVRASAQRDVEDARERLRLWGLTEEQIADIERRAKTTDHLTIYSPIAGIVVNKDAAEGMYVDTGTRIYTVADLSRVWVLLDAYESDLAWLRYGQEVSFETEAYPGETFHGQIAFIDPLLDDRTRTIKVRVNVPNEDGRLKPEMFVRAVVRARVAAGGRVIDTSLVGKWISPMHPEIVKDGPGTCDVCGMPLVRAESLGYVSVADLEHEPPLVIPDSAPLVTGKRALVYVQDPHDAGRFEGREVVLGPRAGNVYLVREGLAEGEKVVTYGNFKVDSAVQLLGKPSMMSPEGGAPPAHDHGGAGSAPRVVDSVPAEQVPDAFRKETAALFEAYFAMQDALSRDNLEQAKAAAKQLAEALDRPKMEALGARAHEVWMAEKADVAKILEPVPQTDDIEKARMAFALLSEAMNAMARNFAGTGQPILRYHCPMAFDWRGADWLQNREGVANPYFGSAMFRCGTLEETIVAAAAQPHDAPAGSDAMTHE